MVETLGAIAPVFLIILVGFLLRRWKVLSDGFWLPAEKLTYFITFPALLAANLAGADLRGVAWAPVAAVSVGGIFLIAALMLAARSLLARRLAIGDPAFTSVFQGAIRPNTYIGLALATVLFGPFGVTLMALCIAIVVPLVNVLAVACMVRFGHGQSASLSAMARGIATNPLILACLVGIAMNIGGLGLPPVLGPALTILGSAALPIGLLAVGAGLSGVGLRRAAPALLVSSAAKLVLLPGLTLIGALALGMDAPTTALCVLYAALPCSQSSYVLARQMGGDATLMATAITVQTLLSGLSIPVFVLALV
ncbi:AEC family transporter [Rhodospirillum rubrum]|uniref:Auxin Efflux Carrier n=1 Tax=Rhodospirillum rubrum (strain ATCC 11170 / ATH 1.1.1 / DSM 467 / LMG 4362 / NCIMB 8255 / S1) TaxID=269796 RepID=Q2RPG8_RHORT|nr:AEC family transporter [Rhodospirillum rubrum]ABC23977.1 Auxin Efflux Carrier [Rhodospirillum rubrum ATCC 11170]AEO49722.1 auxin efflux carrier [Rhodospirillum rubrum F11]MBK5955661.1 transporter [Rhodospirillum rubrum]QXG79920.1 AEC family transporter [Rhodospirillum rubrum]HAP99255.1 AEC family transporter [Rhodospirillum rubrum]